MENYEYNKSLFDGDEASVLGAEDSERFKEALLRYEEDRNSGPLFIIPGAPAIFEEAVTEWEEVAREYGGRISAKIDYTHYDATIDVWCSYLDFDTAKLMSILRGTTRIALSICITPLTSDELRIEILMPYFTQVLES